MSNPSFPQSPGPTSWPPPPSNQAYPPAQESPLAALEGFSSQNVWLVLLLTVVTFGIYAGFWLYRQNEFLGRIRPDLKVPPALGLVVLALLVVSALLDIVVMIHAPASLESASNGLDRITEILLLVFTFTVRGGLNKVLGVFKTDPAWFSGLWTFLFGVIYLQYKINRTRTLWRSGQIAPTMPYTS